MTTGYGRGGWILGDGEGIGSYKVGQMCERAGCAYMDGRLGMEIGRVVGKVLMVMMSCKSVGGG